MPDLSNIHYKFFPKAKTAGTGKKLYYFAWAIEILVAFVALSISVIMLLSGGQSGTQVEELASSLDVDMLLLSFAFVVVAVMELTKIPLATAFYYSAKLNWRILFFIALLVVNFSTFETMVTAFELNYHKRSVAVDTVRNEIDDISEKIDTLSKTNDDTELVIKIKDIENDINQKNRELNNLRIEHNNAIAEINKNAKDEKNSIEESLKEELAALGSQVESGSAVIDLNKGIIINIEKQIEDLRKEKRQLKRDLAEIPTIGFGVRQRRDEIQIQINKIDREILSKEGKITELNDENRQSAGTTAETKSNETKNARENAQNKINNIDDKLREEINRLNENFIIVERDKIQSIEGVKASAQPYKEELDNIGANEKQRRAELKELRELNTKKKDELKTKAKENQVYRLAEKINVIANWFSGGGTDPLLIANDEEIEQLIFENRNLNIENKSIERKLNAEDSILFKKTEEDIIELRDSLALNTDLIVNNENEIALLKSDNQRILEKNELTDGIVSQNEMDRAFWIWFGGLSFVISIIGTLVAFAGLHLQDERTHKILNKPLSSNKMVKHFKLTPVYINKAFKALRERLLRPVKVTVYEEIEVEKIVERIVEKPYEVEKIVEKPIEHVKVEFQRIEVPKEVIRKEIVYVPFPTNDKGVLDKGPYKVKNNKKEYTEEEE
ncbi:hypothetical protein OA413_04085 [Pelagibacteraceae bacterium]|nr:hypothetical protein [Pelagibacteraceae bacterium]